MGGGGGERRKGAKDERRCDRDGESLPQGNKVWPCLCDQLKYHD